MSHTEITFTCVAFPCFSWSPSSSVCNSSIYTIALIGNLNIIVIISFFTSAMQKCHWPTCTCVRVRGGHSVVLLGCHLRRPREKKGPHQLYMAGRGDVFVCFTHPCAPTEERATWGHCHSRGPVRLNLNIALHSCLFTDTLFPEKNAGRIRNSSSRWGRK